MTTAVVISSEAQRSKPEPLCIAWDTKAVSSLQLETKVGNKRNIRSHQV